MKPVQSFHLVVRGATLEETPHQALTLEQLHQLLDAIGTKTLKGLRDKALLTILGRLGLRREEASQLDWSDLYQRQGHQVLRIRHGKGDQAGIAKVPVDVARLLEQYRAALGEETEPMFVVLRKGNRLRRDEADQVIRLDGKGIERLTALRGKAAHLEFPDLRSQTPHDLRATFITLALEGKAPLQTVQYAARHKDPRTTEHYQRRKVNLDDNAVDYIHYYPSSACALADLSDFWGNRFDRVPEGMRDSRHFMTEGVCMSNFAVERLDHLGIVAGV